MVFYVIWLTDISRKSRDRITRQLIGTISNKHTTSDRVEDARSIHLGYLRQCQDNLASVSGLIIRLTWISLEIYCLESGYVTKLRGKSV